MLLGVFAAWGCWVIWYLLMPYINRAKRARLRRAQREQRFRDVLEPVEVLHQSVEKTDAAEIAAMRHVNFRITAYLHAIYPDATWQWCEKDPVQLILNGGVGRIRVFGTDEYNHADIKIDKSGEICCSMMKLVPLSQIAAAESDNETLPPNKQPIDPQIWYETTGRNILENVIADLNSRGHSSLTIQDDGQIQIEQESEDISLETLSAFPEKVYWPRLIKVLQGEGLAAEAQATGIVVTW